MIEQGALESYKTYVVGLVVERGCAHFAAINFPQLIELCILVAYVGRNSMC